MAKHLHDSVLYKSLKQTIGKFLMEVNTDKHLTVYN